jgi:hypothetical protein
MYRKVAPPRAGGQGSATHRVVRPKGTDWTRVIVVDDEPTILLCHWSPLGRRTVPCIDRGCRGCAPTDPWPNKLIGFACCHENNSGAPWILMMPHDAWLDAAAFLSPGELWRGLYIQAKHATADPCSRIVVECKEPIALAEVVRPWNIFPDLNRLWRDYLPVNWAGAYSRPADDEGEV